MDHAVSYSPPPPLFARLADDDVNGKKWCSSIGGWCGVIICLCCTHTMYCGRRRHQSISYINNVSFGQCITLFTRMLSMSRTVSKYDSFVRLSDYLSLAQDKRKALRSFKQMALTFCRLFIRRAEQFMFWRGGGGGRCKSVTQRVISMTVSFLWMHNYVQLRHATWKYGIIKCRTMRSTSLVEQRAYLRVRDFSSTAAIDQGKHHRLSIHSYQRNWISANCFIQFRPYGIGVSG